MLAGRNDFIENDAFNFVFYLIDEKRLQRLDYVVLDIHTITRLPFDIIEEMIDLYNQRTQSKVQYLTYKMFSYAMQSRKELASLYEEEINRIKNPHGAGLLT